MISINKLYGILLGTEAVSAAYQWYLKKFTPMKTSEKINAIAEILVQTVPIDKRALFACLICNAVLHTVFGNEIKELDPVNTYVPVSRPPDSPNDSKNFCLFDMAAPAKSYRPLLQYLDDDIAGRLVSPIWVDYIAAGCLQILRELRNA